MLSAVVRITGVGRLGEFRERLRWLMVRDVDAVDYSETDTGDGIEYRFETGTGIPFPVFAAASSEFPELRIEAQWDNASLGVHGKAVIENGRLVDQVTEPIESATMEVCVEIAADGSLAIAMACVKRGAAMLGYCARAGEHVYFLAEGGSLRLADASGSEWTSACVGNDCVATGDPVDPATLAELEDIAFRLAQDWLWFDEEPAEATVLERQRYANHGWTVRGANVRTDRLLALGTGGRMDTLGPDARALRARLDALWKSGQ